MPDHYYLGQPSRSFKERLANPKASFRNATKRKDMATSEYVLEVRLNNKEYPVSYEKVKESQTAQRLE